MASSKHVFTALVAAPRLDLWLHGIFPQYSRSMLQRLIREEHVRLKGEVCNPKSPVRKGSEITIEFPEVRSAELKPEEMELEILFEDEHLLVMNKPAGIVVHPGAGHQEHTLVHALLHHCRGQLSGIGGVERPGIVHRLDKDTSGCLVIAKTDLVHRSLVRLFQSRSVEKIYLALTWGVPKALSGHIDRPIGRHTLHRKKMCVTPTGRPAQTDWKILEKLQQTSLLQCRIHSGRTHQIRVHLAAIGHPVVGDSLYGRVRDSEIQRLAGRQMLHAWKLRFQHPISRAEVHCEAKIPLDMQRLVDALRERRSRSEERL